MSRPMHRVTSFLAALFLAAIGLLSLRVGRAWGASFEVSPTRLRLSAEATSGLLTVKNQATEPLRFQAYAYAWSESKTGEMKLTKTEDVVFFPSMFTVGAGESRKVRVGALAGFASSERTYRVFIEELPPLTKAGAPNAVKILTRMAIPIFLAPAAETKTPAIGAISLSGDVLAFVVKNTGTAHFVIQTIRVTVLGAKGQTLLDRTSKGWYVLAGAERDYQLTVPAEACANVERVSITIVTDVGKTEAMQVTAPTCKAP